MKLAELVSDIVNISINNDIEVSGIADDSRKIKPGDCFFAFKGTRFNAGEFIDSAIEKKASLVLCEGAGKSFEKQQTVVLFIPDLKKHALTIMLRFYNVDLNKLTLFGVTGTNGKTSIAYWLAQLFDGGYLGTLGNGHWANLEKTTNTTSSPLVITKTLEHLIKSKIHSAAVEVSSHALEQQRAHGLQFESAIFTNLSHEHLDYHGSMEAYYQAKKKLFLFDGLKHAIINIDCEWGRRLVRELAKIDIISFSVENKEALIAVSHFKQSTSGIHALVQTPKGELVINVPFFCTFNLSNLLAVVATLYAKGESLTSIAHKLSILKPVRGRMEKVLSEPTVVIDYAHTPDALEKALINLKDLTQGKLWCVFGCGGDRDKAKRPLMGEIASGYADYSVITNDNPRTESPDEIAREVATGIKDTNSGYCIELDRAKAIAYAINTAGKNDVILIAGKGHEDYQIIGTETLHFSDHETVKAIKRPSKTT